MEPKEMLAEINKGIHDAVNDVMEKRLGEVVTPLVAAETRKIVEALAMQKALTGRDMSGLTTEQKMDFAERVKAVAGFRSKANEALISEQDSRGGVTVPVETANAILRIAASVGIVLGQATKWPLSSDELVIPSYRGSFLEGEYLGVDAAGSVTGLSFASAQLIAKKWQLAFVVGNDLLADANENMANWLLALAGEALANMVDKQAFIGTGAPFVGLTVDANVSAYDLGGATNSGSTTFASFSLDDASEMIASLEESLLDGAAFYFSRTVWSKIRMKKDTAGGSGQGQYIVTTPNGAELLSIQAKNGGPTPAGMLLGFPVYTCRHLPANSATAVSTKFGVFGNMKAMAYGDKGGMTVEPFTSGAFGGKEIALADQKALVLKNRHALVNALPAAFVTAKTSAS